MQDYNNQPMTGISEQDYETLLVHLGEQLASCIKHAPEGEAPKAASDALANTRLDHLTAREWLTTAGGLLGVDTSDCVGV